MFPRRSFLALLAAALVGACSATATPTRAQAPVASAATANRILRLRQLDVGQGDAALVTTAEGRHILIDAGPRADDLAGLLRREGVDTVDLVIASHNHADHIGGMPGVFDAVVVRAYLENGLPQPTAIYRRTLDAIERERGLTYLQASDRTITIGTTTVRILGSPAVNTTQNDNSVGVVIEHGAFTALFTGDSERPQLTAWLQQRRIPKVTVVKVAHHGSRNGTSAALVQATSPMIALVSAGAGNSYGHPTAQAMTLWTAGGARVYRTDLHGTIEIEATRDGRVTVRTGSGAGARPR